LTLRVFGLIGRDIDYSFSRTYFREKFEREGWENFTYRNFDLATIETFPDILKTPCLSGLNVTIPYKEAIIPYLNEVSETACAIGAVNTIVFEDGKTVGHNTDYIGFSETLRPLLQASHDQALILGTGGASKAVAYALTELGIPYSIVSREGELNYGNLTKELLLKHPIVINCTPLGTHPNIDACPPLPYDGFTAEHIAYDLIYNPAETTFLANAKAFGATTKNGYDMLAAQAEAAWQLWQAGF